MKDCLPNLILLCAGVFAAGDPATPPATAWLREMTNLILTLAPLGLLFLLTIIVRNFLAARREKREAARALEWTASDSTDPATAFRALTVNPEQEN